MNRSASVLCRGGDGALHRGGDLGLDRGEDLGDQSILRQLAAAAAAARHTTPEVRDFATNCSFITIPPV